MRKLSAIIFACVAVPSAATGALGWWAGGMPLTVVVDGARATAHMEFLGEYANDVKLIELEQLATSKVIWRVVADEKLVQLYQVSFVAGANAAELRTAWGRARTEIPSNSSEFVLMPHTEYAVRVCPPSWWRRCASQVFQLDRV